MSPDGLFALGGTACCLTTKPGQGLKMLHSSTAILASQRELAMLSGQDDTVVMLICTRLFVTYNRNQKLLLSFTRERQ